MALLAEFLESARIDLANGATASAVRPELIATKLIDEHFTQDAARGIASAQDQYIHHLDRTAVNRLSVT